VLESLPLHVRVRDVPGEPLLVNMKATKMENMISAAAVTTRADSAVPRCTARRASPFLVYSSLIRDTTNTS